MTLTDCAHASRTRWAFACSIASIVLVATLASGCTSAAGTHAVSSASGANSASAAWASPRKALDAKDDAAVYATTGGALKAALGPSASGAAAKVAAMLPTNAGGLIVKQISPDRSWMFDAFDSGSHVQFDRTDGGWFVTEISSAVTRTGKQEHFTPDALHHETDHLPRGVKVTIANPQGGTRARQMRTVTVNGVAGEASAAGSPTVILNPTPGELWVGTGPTYKGSARITELKVGTSHNRYGITHGGRVLSATKVIAIGFRVSSLPSGSGMGAVLGQVARTCARDARLTGR